MRGIRFLSAGALLLGACLACTENRAPADLVIRHAHVITLTERTPSASAVATRGERIVYVGDDAGAGEWIGKRTRVIDAPGCTVTPGLVDAHGHLNNLGRILHEPDLIGTRSIADVVARVRDYQSRAASGEWIHGRGWDQNDWTTTSFPTWHDLAETDANPVYLERVDGHALWVNHRALETCGITRATPDPRGGRIVRDAHGEPTGILIDEAMALIESHVPEVPAQTMDTRLASAIAELNRVGLTGVHDAGTTRPVLESLRRLGAKGALTLNIYSMIDSQDDSLAHEILRRGPSQECGGRLTIRAFKLRADGALGSRGALLFDPYNDDPGNVGLQVQSPETLRRWTYDALEHGFQVGTHAIGDRANHVMLDIYEEAMRVSGRKDARLRMEHAQVLSTQDIVRFAALGVIASMQPTHATSDMPWAAKRVGPERLPGAYAWRTLLTSGAALAFGSDFPVESANPVLGLYAAVTRQDATGNPPGGWYPDQKLTMEEALRAFTTGAAYARFDENDAGKIEAGMRADLTVLDRDIMQEPSRVLLGTHAKYTIVRGSVVYERP